MPCGILLYYFYVEFYVTESNNIFHDDQLKYDKSDLNYPLPWRILCNGKIFIVHCPLKLPLSIAFHTYTFAIFDINAIFYFLFLTTTKNSNETDTMYKFRHSAEINVVNFSTRLRKRREKRKYINALLARLTRTLFYTHYALLYRSTQRICW